MKNKESSRTITVTTAIRMICKNSTNLKNKEIEYLEDIMIKLPELWTLKNLIEEFKLFYIKLSMHKYVD